MIERKNISHKNILSEHIVVLDGARGLAILLVLLYHYFHFIHQGWVGVDLFFVLSGFLITGKLVESLGKSNYYSAFYVRRIIRLIPLYYLILIIFFIVFPIIAPGFITPSLKHIYESQWAYWLFAVNIVDAFNGWPENTILIHFWSLSCEIQFYLTWPFLIYWLYRKKTFFIAFLLMLIIGAALFRLCTFSLFHESGLYRYVLFFSRIDAFSLGALLYVYKRDFENRIRNSIIKYLGCIIPIIVVFMLVRFQLQWHFSEHSINFTGYTVNACFWFWILHAVLNKKEIFLKRVFSNKGLTLLGRYSYGIYIYHLPVFILVTKFLPPIFFPVFTVPLLGFAITLLLSLLSYRLYEKKFLELKNNFL